MIVAPVEVLAPQGDLMEPLGALLGGEDHAPVAHEVRRELLIEQEGQLPDAAPLSDEEVGVGL